MSEETEPEAEQTTQAAAEPEQSEASEAVAVQAGALEELGASEATGEPMGLSQLLDVGVHVTVEVGRTKLSLGELVQLKAGSVVGLDRKSHEPADILVNGKVVASGEIITIDDSYGVRITAVNS